MSTVTVDPTITDALRASQKDQLQRRCLASYTKLVPHVQHMFSLPPGREERAVTSPFTDAPMPPLPQAQPEDLIAAINKARQAQKRWEKVPMSQRTRCLLRLHDLIWRNCGELMDLIQWESGKSRPHAFEEIEDVAITARYYARTAVRTLSPKRRRGALPGLTHVIERYQPKGVVGIISPWNYPLSLAISDALAALTAGNAIILKPDSNTPHIALAIRALLIQAGYERDLVPIIIGSGAQLGTPMIEAVDYLMFTGSSQTGRHIAAQCGQRLINCSAELGGKNPMIVMPDANLNRAVAGAINACFASAGQLCISIERLYVHQDIYEQFKTAFVRQIADMKIAADCQWNTQMGVLISRNHLKTVDAHVQDALAKGARLLSGGSPLPDIGQTAYAPTLLEGVKPGMKLYREETFGPVVSIYPFATQAQAIDLANDTDYGLNASIWSTPTRGRVIAAQIRSGTVNINEGFAPAWASIDAPMGGMGISGLGRRHGTEGLLKYTEAQNIATQRLVPLAGPNPRYAHTWAKITAWSLKAMRHLYLK